MRISPGLTPEILRTAWGREGGRGRRGRGRGGRRRRRRRGRRGGRGGQGGVGEEKKGEMREYKQRRERWEWECENVTGGSATDIISHRSGPILLLVVHVPAPGVPQLLSGAQLNCHLYVHDIVRICLSRIAGFTLVDRQNITFSAECVCVPEHMHRTQKNRTSRRRSATNIKVYASLTLFPSPSSFHDCRLSTGRGPCLSSLDTTQVHPGQRIYPSSSTGSPSGPVG